MTRTYHTLKEILDFNYENWMDAITHNEEFHTYVSQIPSSDEGKELFQNYICPKYLNSVVTYIDNEKEGDITTERVTMYGYFYTWYMSTASVFIKLIQLYKSKEDELLNQVETSSLTKFNDTPQDGGNFDTDDHTTNSTRVSTSTDAGTPIQRLEEIRRSLINFYEQWAFSFGSKFVIHE